MMADPFAAALEGGLMESYWLNGSRPNAAAVQGRRLPQHSLQKYEFRGADGTHDPYRCQNLRYAARGCHDIRPERAALSPDSMIRPSDIAQSYYVQSVWSGSVVASASSPTLPPPLCAHAPPSLPL